MAVALKVDEAPLVLNRGFAETMALKRSAGLETVACWQTDAQWSDPAIRDQLDALFAHRVYFATASVSDARAAASLTMSEFSDTVRPGIGGLSALGRPDARLHLPKHHAIASWSTAGGRQAAFVGRTIPLRVDRSRIALHAARQHARGARHLADLRRRHWDQQEPQHRTSGPSRPAASGPPPSEPFSEPPFVGPAATSYRELVEIDRAQSVRWGRRASALVGFEPEPLDLEMLRTHVRARAPAEQPDPPLVQPRPGTDDHPASPQAPLRRGPRRSSAVPSPGWWRGTDVLPREYRRTGAAGLARRPRRPARR